MIVCGIRIWNFDTIRNFKDGNIIQQLESTLKAENVYVSPVLFYLFYGLFC